jgi:hypothetical protein
MDATKTCNKCLTAKPLSAFSVDARRKDGLNLSCKECRKAYISARKAIKGEASTYQGAPCKNGHKGVRLRTSGNCVDCLSEWRSRNKEKIAAQHRARQAANRERNRQRAKEWRAKNPGYAKRVDPEKRREYHAKWRAKNPDYCRERNRAYWHANRDKLREASKAWRARNAEQLAAAQREKYLARREQAENVEKDRARAKQHYQSHKGYYFAKSQARRGVQRKAIPRWLDDQQWSEIEKIYSECSRRTEATGVKHEVDHIVPLRGDGVSGLHVPWNLQILTAEENRAKGAKHEG